LDGNACRSDHWAGKLFGDSYFGDQREMSIYNYITIASMLLMTLLILVQTRGASLGAGLGSAGEINTERRGTDKTIYQLTIITAIIFTGSILVAILVA
jgi:preprotein translocase subunit SecG